MKLFYLLLCISNHKFLLFEYIGRRPVMEKDILTITEACNILRIGRSTFIKLINTGEIHALKVGRQWRIPKKEIERFLQAER